MKCTKCRGLGLVVLETRRGPNSVYRRRRCKRCDAERVTEEIINPNIPQLPRFDRRVGAHTAK